MKRSGRLAPGKGPPTAAVPQLIWADRYQCGFCSGAGMKGVGRGPAGGVCPVCRGQGEVKISKPPIIKCVFCKGKGEDKPRSNVTCLVCKGAGVMRVSEPIEVCEPCRGRGREVNNSTLPCGSCRGKGVITPKKGGKKGKKRFLRRPSGSEGEAARVVYELGEAGKSQIAREMRVTSAYAEMVCNSAARKGYLIKVDRGVYALSPDCEGVMAAEGERVVDREIKNMRPRERSILQMIQDEGETTAAEISEKLGLAFGPAFKACQSLGKKDLIDVPLKGSLCLTPKGEKVLEGSEDLPLIDDEQEVEESPSSDEQEGSSEQEGWRWSRA